MLSAFITTGHSYPAMHLAAQLAHWRSVHSGPLVLGVSLRNVQRPQQIGDRTVSRRSEPSSRTALIGEQPNPWELLHPQDAMSRHRTWSIFSYGADYIFFLYWIVADSDFTSERDPRDLQFDFTRVGVLSRLYVGIFPFGSVVTGSTPTQGRSDFPRYCRAQLFHWTDGFTVISRL